jgi:hypothetical protein
VVILVLCASTPLYLHTHNHPSMELTFVTDLGQSFVVEIDPNMELENVMALLEAEVSWVV